MNDHLDSAESVFFRRELESISQTLYETVDAPLRSMELIPTEPGIPDWARVRTFRMFDKFGRADWIANMGDDSPRVDVSGKEIPKVIHGMSASYGWDIFEIKASAATGTRLDEMKARAARFAINQKMDRVLALGATDEGKPSINGLFNLPGVTASAVTTPLLDQTSPDEIARVLFDAVASRVQASLANDSPEFNNYTMVMPIQQYTKIAQTRMGDGSNVTILQFVIQNSPWIVDIQPWHLASNAAPDSRDRMVVYPRTPIVLASYVPIMFELLPAQQRNLEFVSTAIATTGGVVVRYPFAVGYVDGI